MKFLFQIPILLFVTSTSSTSAASLLRGTNEKDDEHENENNHRRLGVRLQNSRCKDLSFREPNDPTRKICDEVKAYNYGNHCQGRTYGIPNQAICPESCSDKDSSRYACTPYDRSEKVESCNENESVRINKSFGKFGLYGLLCEELKGLSEELQDEVCDTKLNDTHIFQYCPRTCENTGCAKLDPPGEKHVGWISF